MAVAIFSADGSPSVVTIHNNLAAMMSSKRSYFKLQVHSRYVVVVVRIVLLALLRILRSIAASKKCFI